VNDEPERLAALFRSLGANAGVREDCPPAERIWAAIGRELSAGERAAIVDHLAVCPTCAEAWRLAMALGQERVSAPSRRLAARPTWWLAAAAALILATGVVLWRQVQSGNVGPGRQTVNRPPPLIVALQDGNGRITIDAQGGVEAGRPLSEEFRARVRRALTQGQIDAPRDRLAALRDPPALLMGDSTPGFEVIAPVATMVVSDRPTFEWCPLPAARGYQVTVSDFDDDYRVVATSPEQQTTAWATPMPLARGRIYAWQVVARTPGGETKAPRPEAGEARFKVLTQSEADAVRRAEQVYTGSHLLLALVYAEAGLLDRADAELRALVAANPTSKEARELLLTLSRDARRQP
jgi:Putative zinc-finger